MKTLLICLDGAPFELISSLMERGETPSLCSIAEEGTFGALQSVYPPVTAPAFASILTGQTPANHGVLHFKKDPLDGYGRRTALGEDGTAGTGNIDGERGGTFVTSSEIRGRTFLDFMSMGGLNVGTIGVPLTYPPWDLGGFMVCGFLTPPSATGWALPSSLKADILARFPDYLLDLEWQLDCLLDLGREAAADGDLERWWSGLGLGEKGERLLGQADKVIRQRTELAIRLADLYDPALMMVYYRPPDVIQHYHMDREDVLTASYGFLDRNLGRLIESMGTESNVFVLSDHGFTLVPGRSFNINAWLRREGYLRMKGSPVDRIYRLAYVCGRAIKRRLRPPRKGRDTGRGKLSAGLTRKGRDPIDWKRTIAYGQTGGVCVREGPDARRTAEEVKSRLRRVKDPEDGEPVIEWIALREEAFRGPHVAKFPHIVCMTKSDLTPSLQLTRDVFTAAPKTGRTGTHAMTGIFLARGPAIAHSAPPAGASLIDIAPTILHLHGLALPGSIEGRVLSIFREGAEPAKRSPVRVDSSALSARERRRLLAVRHGLRGKSRHAPRRPGQPGGPGRMRF